MLGNSPSPGCNGVSEATILSGTHAIKVVAHRGRQLKDRSVTFVKIRQQCREQTTWVTLWCSPLRGADMTEPRLVELLRGFVEGRIGTGEVESSVATIAAD